MADPGVAESLLELPILFAEQVFESVGLGKAGDARRILEVCRSSYLKTLSG